MLSGVCGRFKLEERRRSCLADPDRWRRSWKLAEDCRKICSGLSMPVEALAGFAQ
jgi:hypothetical protein